MNFLCEPYRQCACGGFVHPQRLRIAAGLERIPRQIAEYAEFRRAMLAALRANKKLAGWRAETTDDLGLMLLEMWAAVCDLLSFYDEVIAHDCYVRTAKRYPSLRKLVGLLGYVPRPAVAAAVDLAVTAEGRIPVSLPKGTAFRSGAFDGQPPQVFELDENAKTHSAFNRWTIMPQETRVFGHTTRISITSPSLGARPSQGLPLLGTELLRIMPPLPIWFGVQKYFLLRPETASIERDDLLLVCMRDRGNREVRHQAIRAIAVAEITGRDGRKYVKAELDREILFPVGTPLDRVRLLKPGRKAYLRENASAQTEEGTFSITLDGLYPDIRPGNHVIAGSGEIFDHYFVRTVREVSVSVKQTQSASPGMSVLRSNPSWSVVEESRPFEPPPAQTVVSCLTLEGKRLDAADYHSITVCFDFNGCGTVTSEARTTATEKDILQLSDVKAQPPETKLPSSFIFEDKDLKGVKAECGINFESGTLQAPPDPSWRLALPATVYGNIVHATRGETVREEVIGSGDASVPNLSFKLKKKPLSYVPAGTGGNEQGVASTLEVFVSNIKWKEIKSFIRAKPEDRVYTVRHNDAGETIITFGDGKNGARLPTGSGNITANYRFGAGAPCPPAGSITQLAKPVKGLTAVKNPRAAFGGADAESGEGLRINAPRSALILGRAVSIDDMTAVAAGIGGVRAVSAEWRWHETRQSPIVRIWYAGDPGLKDFIAGTIRNLTDHTNIIDVVPAVGVPAELAIRVEIDPDYQQTVKLDEIRSTLVNRQRGILAPENIGIGKPLYISRIHDAILSIDGVGGVYELRWNGSLLTEHTLSPGSGRYFDLESGSLMVSGKEEASA